MASFVLRSSSADGHIRALSKAITVASKITHNATLEFTPLKMKILAKTDLFVVKFTFCREFFTEFNCGRRHRCHVNLKALLLPFKSGLINCTDKDNTLRASISLRCYVEDEINNQIVFKVGGEPPSTTLTYRLNINDLDPETMSDMNSFNRPIDYYRVELRPKPSKRDRFLLSAFNNFAPDIDQVTIRASASEIKFIGSTSPLYNRTATSEFTHKRDDFDRFEVKEDTSITIPLRYLRLFLGFVETSKLRGEPLYTFEGVGQPAHFRYDSSYLKAYFISATPMEFIPEAIEVEPVLPIMCGGPNESFIADENIIQPDDVDQFIHEDDNEDDEQEEYDGYNDNESDTDESFLDGNLDGLNVSVPPQQSGYAQQQQASSRHNNSVSGAESIRSEMKSINPDPEKVREILALDEDPYELENVKVRYSSESEDE